MKVNVPLLNLVCLKTLSPIQKIIKATVPSQPSKLSKCSKSSKWQVKLKATACGTEPDDYLQQIFRGGKPSIALRDFISQTFSIFEFISPKMSGVNTETKSRN